MTVSRRAAGHRWSRRAVRVVVVVAALAGLAACSSGDPGPAGTVTVTHTASPPPPPSTVAPSTSTAPASSPAPSKTKKTRPSGPPVHIKLFNVDGSTYGVGMPVIVFFSRPITNAKAFQKATKLTIDGRPAKGAWYFETSAYLKGYPYEAHFRMARYWPAHSNIRVNMPVKGLSAGKYVFDNSLSLRFSTGPKNVAVVDNNTHRLTLTTDGKKWGTVPVSLGARNTPTLRGTKVVMEKVRTVCMSGNPPNGPAYHECGVKWDQRLTYGGEYLHAAPWNCEGHTGCEGPENNIGSANSSNGCTNLLPTDAKKLYDVMHIGDVVKFPNASGPRMQLGEGYGDWNVSWGQWQTGGLVSTR